MGSFFSWLGGNSQDYFNGLSSPTAAQLQYTPAQVRAAQSQAAQIRGNAMQGVSGDVGAQAAQNQVLQQEQQEALTGMTPGDKAALAQSLQAAAQQSGAQQKAILQRAAETGQAGGGAGLAAALEANQAAGTANSNAALTAAQQAQARQAAARGAVSQMGANINQQTTQRQQAAAEAENAINAANVNATNQVGEFNAQNQNQTALANAAAQDAASKYNALTNQQQYENEMNQAAGKAGAYQNSFNTGVGLASLGAKGIGGALSGDGSGSGEESLAHGGMAGCDYRDGGRVPGRAEEPGDSATNDTVDAKLSKGEVVVPRSVVAQGPKSMFEFLCATVAGHKPATQSKSKKNKD